MLGLAALTALMTTAFVGAGSAMAENIQLCGHDGSPCEAVHHLHETSVGKAKLLTSIGTVECTALFLGDVSSYGAVATVIGNFTYSGCTLGGSSCTAKEENPENAPSKITVEKIGVETTKITGEGLIHLICGTSIDCSYNGTNLVGTGKGPLISTQANGEVSISEETTTKEAGGFLCPKTAKLDITTTPLSKIYIAKEELGYCVKTEHMNGIYTDSTCKTVGATGEHEYVYTLVFAPVGGKAGEPVCYGTLLPYGLWKVRNAFSGVCEEDDLGKPTTSLYEKGTVATVE
jgi:hypothetical protein